MSRAEHVESDETSDIRLHKHNFTQDSTIYNGKTAGV